MKIILVFLLIFWATAVNSQTQNINLLDYKVVNLPEEIKETSGLVFYKDDLYTHNDSGNASEFYKISKTTGAVEQTYALNFSTKDFEAIDGYCNILFLGDFGNNTGKRTDLKIYKLKFEEGVVGDFSSTPFLFPENTIANNQTHNHNFDVEAFVYKNGIFHIFTKEWQSKKVTRYVVNAKEDQEQHAEIKETYDIGYTVTDAKYFNNRLYLIGYKIDQGQLEQPCYLTVFEVTEDSFFHNPITYNLGNIFASQFAFYITKGIGQIEGLAINEDGIYISSEAFKHTKYFVTIDIPSQLFFIPRNNDKNLFPDIDSNALEPICSGLINPHIMQKVKQNN